MKKIALVALIAFTGGVAGAQTQGIFAEDVISFDGVKLRRVRDRSERVVCYALVGPFSGYYAMHGYLPALSCLREEVRP